MTFSNASRQVDIDSPDKPIGFESIARRMAQCPDLPSPPAIAERLLCLGQDPQATMNDIVAVVSLDPAITAKVLRLANSPLYARRRKATNLRQAITLFGVEGTLTLALSFSLVRSLHQNQGRQLNLNYFWKRSITVASCSQAIARHFNTSACEDQFLAGLLQDIGILALEKVMPELYDEVGDIQYDHQRLCEYEQSRLGTDHASIGAWLVENWNLPQNISDLLKYSHHGIGSIPTSNPQNIRIGILASQMADLLLNTELSDRLDKVATTARDGLDLDMEDLSALLGQVKANVDEAAQLFNIDLGDTEHMDALVEQAKETLTMRHLMLLGKTADLQASRDELEMRTQELEQSSHRDPLTGLYNRAWFDKVLEEEFKHAVDHGWPLSIAFIDLDRFKHVNDTWGHLAGDRVLERTGQLLAANSRADDIVVRYGGEEFVAILPGTGPEGAKIMAERVLKSFRLTGHDVSKDVDPVVVTVSIGLASFSCDTPFNNPRDLVRAADEAVYNAKSAGRNQACSYSKRGQV